MKSTFLLDIQLIFLWSLFFDSDHVKLLQAPTPELAETNPIQGQRGQSA
jgi:hypothetical protein